MLNHPNSPESQHLSKQAKLRVRAAFEPLRTAFAPVRECFPMPGKPFSAGVFEAVDGSLPEFDRFLTVLTDNALYCCFGKDRHYPERIRSELAHCAESRALSQELVGLAGTSEAVKQDYYRGVYEAAARVYNSCVDARDHFTDPAGVAGATQ